MPDSVKDTLRRMSEEDALHEAGAGESGIRPMPGQERRDWFDQHPWLREIGQALTMGALDPRLHDDPPGPADLVMQAIPLPGLHGSFRFNGDEGGLRNVMRHTPEAMRMTPEDFGLTPADFLDEGIGKDISYTGWGPEAASKLQRIRGSGSGRPLNMEMLDRVARGLPFKRPGNSTSKMNAIETIANKHGLTMGSPVDRPASQAINDPMKYRRASGRIDDDLLKQIRELGNGELVNLTPQAAAREVKKRLGLQLSDSSVRDIITGSSFPRPGMKLRNP